jgi:DNA-binding response OmpR family regulator
VADLTRFAGKDTPHAREEHPVKPRVLVADDEPRIRNFIGRALTAAGIRVEIASTGAEALQLATAEAYDLVLLDLLMPDLDGRVVLERLMRSRPEQPVVVLSCVADVSSKVTCFNLGAQDYLTKPFSLDELLARVRARLRSEGHRPTEMLRVGDLTLDTVRLQADRGHGAVALTRLEFLLLRELMDQAGHSVPKGELLFSVWGYAFDPGSNVVDVCVRRLRRKLGFGLIKTVRGEGYRLAAG